MKWRCRRGMRELDLFFEPFLARDFDNLDEQQLLALEELLAHSDQDILAWLSDGRAAPSSLAGIVNQIRSALVD